jgi:virginiamycin A acetyltransferase
MRKNILIALYGLKFSFIRALVLRIVSRTEGGEFFSPTLREIFKKFYGVEIGMYSHGGCFEPHLFGKNTTFGRYCSVAKTAFGATLNHPMDKKSMHGFFFNPALGFCGESREYGSLSVGNDVWFGHNSIVMPSVSAIGDGAVIGAGAVVFKDVPPYAVVVGNPGRVVRYRFDKETIDALLEEKWWNLSIEQLREKGLGEYIRPYGNAQEKSGEWQ